MDINNDEIKLHMYQAAKIAIKREGSDGSIVAAWNIADENSGCSAMIAGNGHNCVVAIANIIDFQSIHLFSSKHTHHSAI